MALWQKDVYYGWLQRCTPLNGCPHHAWWWLTRIDQDDKKKTVLIMILGVIEMADIFENLCFWFHVYQYNQSHVHLQPLSLSSSPKFKLFVHKEIISKSLSVGNKAVWSTIIKRLTETGKSQINMIIVYLLDLCWICVVSVLYSCFSHFNLKLHSVHCRLYTEVFNKTCLHTAHFTR